MSRVKGNKDGFRAGDPESNRSSKGIRGKRVKKSPLRKTLAALVELEPKSLSNIKDSVNGDPVDKETLATSKWVVQQVVAVGKAATTDEETLNGLHLQARQLREEDMLGDEEEKSAEVVPIRRFSTVMLDSVKKDLE